jgi:hypothetical protein
MAGGLEELVKSVAACVPMSRDQISVDILDFDIEVGEGMSD